MAKEIIYGTRAQREHESDRESEHSSSKPFFPLSLFGEEGKKNQKVREERKKTDAFLALCLPSLFSFSLAHLTLKSSRRAHHWSRGCPRIRAARERAAASEERRSKGIQLIAKQMAQGKRSNASAPAVAAGSPLSRSNFFSRHDNVALYVPNLIGEFLWQERTKENRE